MSYWNWNFLFIRTGWTVLQNVYVCLGNLIVITIFTTFCLFM